MSDPQGALAIFAEVSVALAGFSGIVIAFGRRTAEALDDLERRRLSNLFILSGLALFVSLFGIALIDSELKDASMLWRGGSATLLLFATPWLVWDVVRVRRLKKSLRARMNTYILYAFNSLAASALLLQFVNLILLGAAWPLLLALVLTIAGAFQQFVLLVRMYVYEKQ